jgi:hypothetical protein
MGDNQKRCQMSEEVKERNITLEMTIWVFFLVHLAKVYYVAMVEHGRMNCSIEGRNVRMTMAVYEWNV